LRFLFLFQAPPLIDTVLLPGQMLYIPAGFPHTTDTLEEPSAEASIHLTIGDMGALFFIFFLIPWRNLENLPPSI
jgi:hypothetical protein